jgi:hypothetical protein
VLLSVPAILVCGLCERQSETASVANAANRNAIATRFHFHPSLWAPGDHDLLVAQGNNRIDAHRPPRRNVARPERDAAQ